MSQSKFRPLAFLAVVALTAVLVGALVAVDADAARGARGGGGGKGGGSGTITVSPSPVPLGTDSIDITGGGFGGNKSLRLDVAGMMPDVNVTTDSTGAFVTTFSPWSGGFDMPGTGYVYAYDSRGNRVGETYFTVCSTNPCQ